MMDEPLVVPVSPGAALTRLAQVRGALQRHSAITALLPAATLTDLDAQRDGLWHALESGAPAAIETALHAAQNYLGHLYGILAQAGRVGAAGAGVEGAGVEGAGVEGSAAVNLYTALGFPDPQSCPLHPVNTETIIATFTCPARQMLTTLAFQDAAGATAYWLQEIRIHADSERVEDYIMEVSAPIFPRLRLPSGSHTFRIESRNNHNFILSPEFRLEVPHR